MGKLNVVVGFDCDRPRGDFINSVQGEEMAHIKIKSLESISSALDALGISRTYFICGMFLESMSNKFGKDRLRDAFDPTSPLVEIADHTYSHNVLKKIPSRPDKTPVSSDVIIQEYDKNTQLFTQVFEQQLQNRGFRAPLGHYQGLQGETEILDGIRSCDILYISSDNRDSSHSINPPLQHKNGRLRQPYLYDNGLLEIPTHGWQDTAFGGCSNTPLTGQYPHDYEGVVKYYQQFFREASDLSREFEQDFFLGLSLHPYNVALYANSNNFFEDLYSIVQSVDGSFCNYNNVFKIFNSV